jgi:sigma-B regulation protein RsbU (phosphoserine phosphatase)
VLIADDQSDVRLALELLLRSEGFETRDASTPAELLATAAADRFDVVLMDLNYTRDTTSGEEGMDALARLRERDPDAVVVVMTAWASVELAVDAMRRGAADFVLKPWDNAALVETLRRHAPLRRRRERNRRSERRLSLAGRVQAHLLPDRGPDIPGLEYAAASRSAEAVGGDLYDFLEAGPDRLLLVLADASGKGFSGALLMAHLQAAIRGRAPEGGRDLAALTEAVNGAFFTATAAEHYATAVLCLYEAADHRLSFANAGHPPPLLLRRDGVWERLASGGRPLGLFSHWGGRLGALRLDPGDVLALYSDGVLEARDAEGDEFGEERLRRALLSAREQPIEALPRGIAETVSSFAGGEPDDDLTLLVARARRPSGEEDRVGSPGESQTSTTDC